ncbi:MAG: hypothetical protein SPH89_04495 [Candidatus Limisoma sp.]|nr:hypothetical protein [Candidatus Limisoma sp.]
MSKSTITTDPLRGSRCWVASFPTLSISDAERRVYHNRSVSDAHNPHRTFGTMWMHCLYKVCQTTIEHIDVVELLVLCLYIDGIN